MKVVTNTNKIINQYEQEGEKIISQMLNILDRAQRKVDDSKYRKTLEKLLKKSI